MSNKRNKVATEKYVEAMAGKKLIRKIKLEHLPEQDGVRYISIRLWEVEGVGKDFSPALE